ncbi:MAG: hypothetical protein K8R58_05985, partial [Bacteroidales bacterium]|nr:hypothetical protein [Bacteroidales bacterium]
MEKQKKYRYPGVNYFKTTDKDIFCGRTEDARKLFTQIMLSDTMVLHAESGVGKSSLIQAGIIPMFAKSKSNYIPVTIRFGGNISKIKNDKDKDSEAEEFLILETIKQINEQYPIDETELPYIKTKEDDLWCVAKLFEKQGQSLLLIFDQFEELQVYSRKQIDYFKQKLSELFHSGIPALIDDDIDQNTPAISSIEERKEHNDNISFLEQPLSVRAVFVVREDKLGTMSLLSDYFPNILKNDYILLPLDRQNAKKAIEEPAKKPGDNYKSSKFSFKGEAIEHLLDRLDENKTGFFDPFQIQIVCSNIEKKVTESNEIISTDKLPKIIDTINDFYKEKWNNVKEHIKLDDQESDALRKKIIQELVINEKRNLVHKDVLLKTKEEEEIVNELLKEGLLLKN